MVVDFQSTLNTLVRCVFDKPISSVTQKSNGHRYIVVSLSTWMTETSAITTTTTANCLGCRMSGLDGILRTPALDPGKTNKNSMSTESAALPPLGNEVFRPNDCVRLDPASKYRHHSSISLVSFTKVCFSVRAISLITIAHDYNDDLRTTLTQ